MILIAFKLTPFDGIVYSFGIFDLLVHTIIIKLQIINLSIHLVNMILYQIDFKYVYDNIILGNE